MKNITSTPSLTEQQLKDLKEKKREIEKLSQKTKSNLTTSKNILENPYANDIKIKPISKILDDIQNDTNNLISSIKNINSNTSDILDNMKKIYI
ncbi:MAG: hypothetical protein CR959_00295 [Fusobacteriales bacterium]|nr:MAG: hypothetical protein CR959_00295 [Fusobacteriales bacterium]